MNSIEYYDKNTHAYYARTIHHDMSDNYNRFLALLPDKAIILDAGCGPGRDALYFKQLGHLVTAFDASIEMVQMSTEIVGQATMQLRFQDLAFENQFDGVWASASLLHIPFEELRGVLAKLRGSLKSTGIFYASFKYGNGKRQVDERAYYDLDEVSILPYLKGLFDVIQIWKTEDSMTGGGASSANACLRILCKVCENKLPLFDEGLSP